MTEPSASLNLLQCCPDRCPRSKSCSPIILSTHPFQPIHSFVSIPLNLARADPQAFIYRSTQIVEALVEMIVVLRLWRLFHLNASTFKLSDFNPPPFQKILGFFALLRSVWLLRNEIHPETAHLPAEHSVTLTLIYIMWCLLCWANLFAQTSNLILVFTHRQSWRPKFFLFLIEIHENKTQTLSRFYCWIMF